MRACIVCGRPSPAGQSRCAAHALPQRGWRWTAKAKAVTAGATRCYLCGEGPRADDPFVCHHIRPRSLGGSDDFSNLAPSHASCNGSAGNRVKGELNRRQRER